MPSTASTIVYILIDCRQYARVLSITSSLSQDLQFKMPTRTKVLTDKAPAPLPQFSQAIVCNGMIYCSGNIGIDPKTNQVVGGSVTDRTVRTHYPSPFESLILWIVPNINPSYVRHKPFVTSPPSSRRAAAASRMWSRSTSSLRLWRTSRL